MGQQQPACRAEIEHVCERRHLASRPTPTTCPAYLPAHLPAHLPAAPRRSHTTAGGREGGRGIPVGGSVTFGEHAERQRHDNARLEGGIDRPIGVL